MCQSFHRQEDDVGWTDGGSAQIKLGGPELLVGVHIEAPGFSAHRDFSHFSILESEFEFTLMNCEANFKMDASAVVVVVEQLI